MCEFCRHVQIDKSMCTGDLCCDAFPKGIPVYILWGYDHRESYPNDHGIRFEIRDDLTDLDVVMMQARMETRISEDRNRQILEHRRQDIENYLKSKTNSKQIQSKSRFEKGCQMKKERIRSNF